MPYSPNPEDEQNTSFWNAMARKTPALAVDAVIQMPDQSIVLIRRQNPPFEGAWALPGGFCKIGESVEEAVCREAREETGLLIDPVALIGVFSDPTRDPRGHIVSIAFLAKKIGGRLKAGSDAKEVATFHHLPAELAFDHSKILVAADLDRDHD
jgi:8-oxo-dGTP diphosphatase